MSFFMKTLNPKPWTPGATQRACEIFKELTKSCEKDSSLQNNNFVLSEKRDFHTNPNLNHT
jgi:hypothetical protein